MVVYMCVHTDAHLLTFSLELAIMFTHLHLLPISLNMGTGEVSVNKLEKLKK